MDIYSQQLSEVVIELFRHRFRDHRFANCLKKCSIYRELDVRGNLVLVIDCPDRQIADTLWGYPVRGNLASIAELLGVGKRVILRVGGCLFGSTSPHSKISDVQGVNMISPLTELSTLNYADLLHKLATSNYASFATEMPLDWYWGCPVRCLMASPDVTQFSGRKALKWQNDDVTILYEKREFERQYKILVREFDERPNKDIPYVYIPDVEYKSFSVDKSRETLMRESEHEYLSDFEIFYLQDSDTLIRLCHCKERRLIANAC